MKLPRDMSGEGLAKALKALGYQVTRQTGSHMRLTTTEGGEPHITIPWRDSLRVGTFASILDEVGTHFGLSRKELVEKIKN